MNIASILEKAACYFPEQIAVIENDKSVRFNQFNRVASRVASALNGRGIRPGDHVALCAANSYAWLVFYFGVMRAGAMAVTFKLLKREIKKQFAWPLAPMPTGTATNYHRDHRAHREF